MRHHPRVLFSFAWALAFGLTQQLSAQTSGNANPTLDKGATYVSEVDASLSIRKVTVLPVVDNVDGIYSHAFESELISVIQNDHKWDFVEAKTIGPISSPQDLEGDANQVMVLGKTVGTDALLASRISKGPDGISIRLSLFLTIDGKLLVTEELTKIQNFDLKNIQAKARELLATIRSRIPYQGLVLSRSNTRVTLNLGLRDGVKKDQVVSAIQIIKLIRHPKFSFIISTEKEILGKIKLRKVEETLSFGDIVSEKERGSIQKLSKITGLDFVEYPDVSSLSEAPNTGTSGPNTPEHKVSFGDKPQEWTPVKPASFGLVNVSLGLGSYSLNAKPPGGNETYSASKPFFFNLKLHGELWFNPEWQVETDLRQGIMTVGNPRSASTPAELNISTSTYDIYFTYNWLIRDDFWGPKISIMGGFKQYSSTVDNSSPLAYTTMTYRGLDLGLKGSIPLDDEQQWRGGAIFKLMLFPAMSERPISSSDSPSNTVNVFSVFVANRIGQRLEATGELEMEYYSSTFAGGTSASQRITTVYGGINYMF